MARPQKKVEPLTEAVLAAAETAEPVMDADLSEEIRLKKEIAFEKLRQEQVKVAPMPRDYQKPMRMASNGGTAAYISTGTTDWNIDPASSGRSSQRSPFKNQVQRANHDMGDLSHDRPGCDGFWLQVLVADDGMTPLQVTIMDVQEERVLVGGHRMSDVQDLPLGNSIVYLFLW